jgi:hypothetical protein
VLEVRRAVTHGDRVGHADPFQRLRFEGERVLRRIRTRVIGHVDQRRRGEFDRGETRAECAGREHLVEQFLRHRLAGLVVQRVLFEHFRHGQPMLVELRRQLDEIARHGGSSDRRPGHVGQHAV